MAEESSPPSGSESGHKRSEVTYLEQALWQQLATAETDERFWRSWLDEELQGAAAVVEIGARPGAELQSHAAAPASVALSPVVRKLPSPPREERIED